MVDDVNAVETPELLATQSDGADIPAGVAEPQHQDSTPLDGSPS